MSEPYNYRPSMPSQPGRPQGWTGTSKLPMQALGAPPPDLPPSGEFSAYPPQQRRPGGGPGGPGGPEGPGGPAGWGGRGPGRFFADRGRLADYALKGLGLLGVALVSGFLWYLIRNNPATPAQTHTGEQTQTAGTYAFQPYQPSSTVTNCVTHSTGEVRGYLEQHPCTKLTRSLFTTSLTNGDRVITSVAVVEMDDNTAATGLKKISDGNGTGHVKDLVEDGTVVPNGPRSLQEAGYYSTVKGPDAIIVMTEYVDGTKDTDSNLKANDATLKAVSQDAAQQGIGVNN